MSEEIIQRAIALVRRLAASVKNEELYGGWAWRDEARAIIKEIDADPGISVYRTDGDT